MEGRNGAGYGGDDGALSRYLRDVKRHPLLTREEEVHYARAVQKGSASAKETLVNSNLRFVHTVLSNNEICKLGVCSSEI